MKLGHFFVRRPIFATVLSLLLVLVGSLSYFGLPVEQYPEVVPPAVLVRTSLPGASAETVAKTVGAPIEEEVNGVEGMLYMRSQSTSNGFYQLTVTFELGTDPEQAAVLVQNRVATALARLPEQTRRIGVQTRKSSNSMLVAVNVYSPNETLSRTFAASYADIHIRDRLARLPGAGLVSVYGGNPFAMRIWLDRDRLAARGINVAEVIDALRAENNEVSAGALNKLPVPKQAALEIQINTEGRLNSAEDFEEIIVKRTDNGIVRLGDVGRAELGSQTYGSGDYTDDQANVNVVVFQRPGSNALETVEQLKKEMEKIAEDFPEDLAYRIVYNPTQYVQDSMDAVTTTIIEAVILVVIIIGLFLQTWRASLIPIVAIPVSLIATFAAMALFGYSLNMLTLFGLVLAIGIVVDDAIVVVENMERNMAGGMSGRDAALATMSEVSSALVAMGLVIVAAFLPSLFIEGLSGRFYTQFGFTICVATMLSVLVSLSLSPALGALILHPGSQETAVDWRHPLRSFFALFNRALNALSRRYQKLTRLMLGKSKLSLVIYALLIIATLLVYQMVPGGFIPSQDRGFLIAGVQLPAGSAISRTETVTRKIANQLRQVPEVDHTVAVIGLHAQTFTGASNGAIIFLPLKRYEERKRPLSAILDECRQITGDFMEARAGVFVPPAVPGIGSRTGFEMVIRDDRDRGSASLKEVLDRLAQESRELPEVTGVYNYFDVNTPQLHLEIDYEKGGRLGLDAEDIVDAIEVYLGSRFVNEFTLSGRSYRVTAQAEESDRFDSEDIKRIRVRNHYGDMVPLGSIIRTEQRSGPFRVARYNGATADPLLGGTAEGYSSGQALDAMERLASERLPDGYSFEWTNLALQERLAGGSGSLAFVLAVLFVFLLLAAQFESWSLPFVVILIVPMCLLSALGGLYLLGRPNDILTQIGLVVLVGLASKNAILIVEFAKQKEDDGADPLSAALEAARLRLRPILMTALSFIVGVIPLVIASGAGSELQRSVGTAVFFGMLGVTCFGLIFTPLFYAVLRTALLRRRGS